MSDLWNRIRGVFRGGASQEETPCAPDTRIADSELPAKRLEVVPPRPAPLPEPEPGPVRPSSLPDIHTSPESRRPRPRPGYTNPFARDHNDFAVALFAQLRHEVGNLFFSPFSIRAALGMTYAGAKGETAAQMSRALRLTESSKEPHASFREVIERLDATSDSLDEIAMANSLWSHEALPIRPEFLDLLAQHYNSIIKPVDFLHGAEAARCAINQWVEDETRSKIRDLIPVGGVTADTRLVLVNAIYFKGLWQLPFDETSTSAAPFYLEGGCQVDVRLMRQERSLRYMKGIGYQAVELDYRGGDRSMLVLLPDRKDGLGELEETLSVSMLQDCMAQMDEREIELFLPRFQITWGTVDLTDSLAALGMPIAFESGRADFSGIDGQRPPPDEDALFLSAVFHQAIVEVNEEGTEAAAATAISAWWGGPAGPSTVFRADHPFLYFICDRRSGTILFLGRMADPSSS